MWSRKLVVRVAAVVIIVATVFYRETMLYVFLRLLFDHRQAHGGLPAEFAEGARVTYAYAKMTSLYAFGSAVLLGILAVVPRGRMESVGDVSQRLHGDAKKN
jgi:hypothetical protein